MSECGRRDWSALVKRKAGWEGGDNGKFNSLLVSAAIRAWFPSVEASPLPLCCPSVASVAFAIYFLPSLGAAARGVSLLCRLFLMLPFPC